MYKPLLLDQSALAAFQVCPRRFQLRYILKLAWPSAPLDRRQSQAVERGRQFHRLIEQRFLGVPVEEEAIADDVVRDWWARFADSDMALADGRRWPEHRLTIPVGENFLSGRFDLLIVGEERGEPFAHLFDWKTSKPRAISDLEAAWQTRLYLALLAEGGRALSEEGRPIAADRIKMTYWYTREADHPRVLAYNEARHRENWSGIGDVAAQIEAYKGADVWPLTEDWRRCRGCPYQVYCGRQEAGAAANEASEEDERAATMTADLLEPQTP